ncbi:MAG TPA: NAD(P)H-dependent oxidoreductase, partial [Burkholderiaceae bacterium]
YNNSIPGSLKNGLDWLSRPSGEGLKTFGGKPVAVMGATPGGAGTLIAQDHLLTVLRAFQVQPWWGGRITLSRVDSLLDADGHVLDAKLNEQLRSFMAGFAAYIEQIK